MEKRGYTYYPTKGLRVQVEGSFSLKVRTVTYKSDSVEDLVKKTYNRLDILRTAFQKESAAQQQKEEEQAQKATHQKAFVERFEALGLKPLISVGTDGTLEELRFYEEDAAKVLELLEPSHT